MCGLDLAVKFGKQTEAQNNQEILMMYISGAKLNEHRSNISSDILDVITFLIYIIQKCKYL